MDGIAGIEGGEAGGEGGPPAAGINGEGDGRGCA